MVSYLFYASVSITKHKATKTSTMYISLVGNAVGVVGGGLGRIVVRVGDKLTVLVTILVVVLLA